jgi:hypothetical protein
MLNIMIWVHATLPEPQPELTIIEQVPNYGGPTATVFYLAGGILLGGALLLWGVYHLRDRHK